ncbi:ABC-three component system protein [Aliarcobacter butzleri]
MAENTSINNHLDNVEIDGDFIGRDKKIILPTPTQIDKHNENYKNEFKNNETSDEIIDKLNHYKSNIHNLRNLQIKLTNAGFEYLIDEALELKQEVSKLIIKHQNYKSAQQIILWVLSKVESIFKAKIKPKLKNIKDEHEIRVIFLEELENELEDKLGENVLHIYNQEIQGMAYFLTGNCHIEWE